MSLRPASSAKASSRVTDGGFPDRSVGPRPAAAVPLRLRVSAVKNKSSSPSRLHGNSRELRVARHPPLDTFFPDPKSKIQNSKSTLPPRATREAAFSLTEVVIALGIFAVSMVGVLALFPVASATSRESSEETQAAILAQTVFSDLRSSAAGRGATNAWLVSGKNTFGDFVSPIRLSVTTNVAIAYDIKRRDWADSAAGGGTPLIGPPLALKALQAVSSNEYRAGVANLTNVTYLTQLRLEPATGVPNLALATVEVSTPAAVGQTNRRTFQFSTLVFGP